MCLYYSQNLFTSCKGTVPEVFTGVGTRVCHSRNDLQMISDFHECRNVRMPFEQWFTNRSNTILARRRRNCESYFEVHLDKFRKSCFSICRFWGILDVIKNLETTLPPTQLLVPDTGPADGSQCRSFLKAKIVFKIILVLIYLVFFIKIFIKYLTC